MDLVEYLSVARDAYISSLNKTKEGQDYLNRCWVAEQTKPDRDALRRNFQIQEV